MCVVSLSGYAMDPTAETAGDNRVIGDRSTAEESKGEAVFASS